MGETRVFWERAHKPGDAPTQKFLAGSSRVPEPMILGKKVFFFIVWFCAKSARNIKCLLIFDMKNETCYIYQFYIVAKMGIFPKAWH